MLSLQYIFVLANVAVGSCCVDLKFVDPWSLAIQLQLRFSSKVLHACARSGTFSFWWILVLMKPFSQATDPAPRGKYRGRAPRTKIVAPPPKRGLCCPKEIYRLGATGVQIEAQIGVFFGLTSDFMTFLGWRPFFLRSPVFGRKIPCKIGEDLFFFRRSPVFGQKNRLNFRFRPENPFESLVFTLFILSRLG